VYLPTIRQDIQDIVSWTDEHFGEAATGRYAALIVQAFEDLQDDPQRQAQRRGPIFHRTPTSIIWRSAAAAWPEGG
jgi:plasmid stabilization system protein ParE